MDLNETMTMKFVLKDTSPKNDNSVIAHISGPQTISGDSWQNSVAPFSETPEIDGDLL